MYDLSELSLDKFTFPDAWLAGVRVTAIIDILIFILSREDSQN